MNAPLRSAVEQVLRELRPEADLAALPADADLREELDLDSMDFLNFVISIHAATGIDVPEADYVQLRTLDRCLKYLAAHGAGHVSPS